MILTNVCSNTVTASIFIPIVAGMAKQAEMHPLSLMLPTTIACSFAFVLPVGTPSNAIAFSSKNGIIRTADMIKAGLLVSIAMSAIMVVYFAAFTRIVFPIDDTANWEITADEVGVNLSRVEEVIPVLLNSTVE